ncbi:MAG: glucuronate isomerase [Clostridium sp.]|nr:glucuronate isomerase [Clostridium sp.]
MQKFMDDTFMLYNETGRRLYESCREIPIFDYHCHLSAKEIYENKKPSNLTELWLSGDHYKWRIMRAHGIEEEMITGTADDYEKFHAYAGALQEAVGNPLFHWSHLELQRYFHITDVLTEKNSRVIWDKSTKVMEAEDFSPRSLILRSNVYGLCTTEDPAASLIYHKKLIEEAFPVKVLPAFRPDLVMEMTRESWRDYMVRLGQAADVEISDLETLEKALLARMDVFEKAGCVASDHGFEQFPWRPEGTAKADRIIKKALSGECPAKDEIDVFQTELLIWLAEEYSRRGWAMELHVGCIRSRNTRMVKCIGEATGFDSVGDFGIAVPLAAFMDHMEQMEMLPKMILFSLNNRDLSVLATMAGNFQNAGIRSKIQLGSAWWFQDHRDGMEEQMRVLANTGLLGHFIGMLTDSRSYLSYTRHEYFRRILCNLVGSWAEKGELPDDQDMLQRIIANICFWNAKEYFGV